MKTKTYLKKQTVFWLAAAIVLMVCIFCFSAQNGTESSGLSLKVSRVFAKVIFFHFGSMDAGQQTFIVSELNFFVRKLAHFSVYMLMGMLSYSAMLIADIQKITQKWAVSLGICALYAAFDEIHQYFIPGRSMRFTDVLIDCSGALIGIAIVKLICITADHIKQNVKLSRKER